MFGLGNCIAGGLLGNTTKISAFPLGLNNATRLAVDEEHVVGGAGFGIHFTNRNTKSGKQVEALFILYVPACRFEFLVDLFAGFGFEFCGEWYQCFLIAAI